MGARQIIISAIVLLSLTRINRQQAKSVARNLVIRLSHLLLTWLSRPHRLRTGPCMVFAPHQDDETLGCGGLIARKRSEGLPVHVIFITDGGASHPGHPRLSAREIRAIRHREALSALTILGVDSSCIHFLDEADGTLSHLTSEHESRLVSRIARLLAQVGPAEIFLPCNPDGSSEHDATFDFICRALREADLLPDIWQYPVWTWWNPGLLLRRLFLITECTTQPTEDYRPIKSLALSCYHSQIAPTPPWPEPTLPPELARSFNSDQEFFFRYVLPPPGEDSDWKRVI